jgi:two-component system, NtrC family, response regulator HydG
MKNLDISNYLEKIISTMNDGLMIIAPDGKVRMVNRAFENLTGFQIPEMVGKPCTFLNCDACEKTLKEGAPWWCDLFEKGEVIRKRCVIVRKDGSYQPVIKNASLLRDENGKLLGAVETLTDISETERLDQRIDHLTHQLDEMIGFHGIVGKSPVMQKIYQVLEKAAQSDAPIAIYGESGTGKELVARAIHEIGRRKNGPFVQLNCAALNEALLESELFGHVKGSFTGAYRHRIGRFEAAHGGELFLDEIADIPLSIQVKLLRVLETKRFERVGDHKPILADVRIVTATNKDLIELIKQKKFRDDLFFRINVIPIHLPLLRERLEDIPLLASTFIERLRSRTGKRITGLTPEVMERFMSHSWPGNVRELNSALEYAFVIAESGRIGLEHLPPQLVLGWEVSSRDVTLDSAEKARLVEALRQSQGNQSEAARILKVSRVTVWNRMRRHGIDLKKVLLP